ncbi:MAG: DMT family transporter [Vicinamibacterales bacterium]
MKLREWGMFFLLGLVWGSSFLWIKVALGNNGEPFLGIAIPAGQAAFSPLLLVTMRLAFGLAGLAVLMVAYRLTIPRDTRTLGICAVVGFINTALPFALITWGETRIPSSLASILNGTVPLFAIVFAHFALHDERMTPGRLAGLVIGFVGVVVLVSGESDVTSGSIWGQAAVAGAAVSYAGAASYTRRYLRGLSPITQSFTTLIFAEAYLVVAVALFERPVVWPAHPLVWTATVWLGLLGSCAAYVLYFSLINAWGATRASLVTYVFPVVGLALGIFVLGEQVQWNLFVGTALVAAGIVIVSGRQLLTAVNARRGAPAVAGR